MGEAAAEEIRDVFISIRAEAKQVLEQLLVYFRKNEIRWWDMSHLNDGKAGDIGEQANEYIVRSRLGVVIISGNRYFSSDARACYQQAEVRAMLQVERTRGGDYPIFFIILQDDKFDPGVQAFKDEMERRHPGMLIGEKNDMVPIQGGVLDGAEADPWMHLWEDPLRNLAANVRRTLPRLRNAARISSAAQRPNAGELEYLRYAVFDSWLKGLGADAPRRDMDASHPAFEFAHNRFITLNAIEAPGGDPATGSTTREGPEIQARPVTHWLFDPTHRRVLLSAQSGAGNTTTLSMAAVAYAAHLEDGLRKRIEMLKPPNDVIEAAQALGAATFMPVMLKARVILERLRDPEIRQSDALFAAVAAVLSNRVATLTPQQARDRMIERPFVVLVDELDRLNDDEEREVLGHLQIASADCAGKIRIVASGRPRRGARVDGFSEIALQRPTASQRDAFFLAYGGQDDARRIAWAARSMDLDALDTPLALNAFCWWALKDQDGGAGENLSELCATLTNTMLKQLSQRPAVASLGLTEERARGILREIAFKDLSGDVEPRAARHIVGAAMKRDGKDIGRDAESKILDVLVHQTALLTFDRTAGEEAYRVKTLLADFLASEFIAETREIAPLLEDVDHQKAAAKWPKALGFACARLFAASDGAERERGVQLVQALLDRARTASAPAEQANWIVCAASALASLPPSYVDEDETPAHQQLLDAASDVFVAKGVKWKPSQRARVLDLMGAAVRRSSARQTRRAVNALMHKTLNVTDDWPSIPGFEHPAGDGDLMRVAGMPVLVAHYNEFLRERDGPDDDLISKHRDRDGESGADVWAELRGRPASPVTFVGLIEALDYCKFLAKRLRDLGKLEDGEIVRLPTKREWDALGAAVLRRSKHFWGDEPLRDGDDAQVNVRSAQIGFATPPGAFAPYGARDLYDFNTNVAVWTLPDRPLGETIWPAPPPRDETVPVVGGHFASRRNEISGAGWSILARPEERSRDRGIRLIRTTRKTGW